MYRCTDIAFCVEICTLLVRLTLIQFGLMVVSYERLQLIFIICAEVQIVACL